MSLDISDILKEWPYDPGRIKVRRIEAEDGRECIQLRLDLGLLQMETTGRPDGQRPHGFESYLEYHKDRLRSHLSAHGSDEGFRLDEADCEQLRTEGVMYYHRYLAAFVLEDYAAVDRDTTRNLRMFDLCSRYAENDVDRTILEEYRPYVVMMRARARAHQALDEHRYRAALEEVQAGVREILDFFSETGQEDLEDESSEVAILQAMAKDIRGKIPVDPIQRLRRELAKAVAEERYEEAARLRDRIEREDRA